MNKELLSTKPTHKYKGTKVKVFTKAGKLTTTAEIMEGPDKGKWTTVELAELKPVAVNYFFTWIGGGFNSVSATSMADARKKARLISRTLTPNDSSFKRDANYKLTDAAVKASGPFD